MNTNINDERVRKLLETEKLINQKSVRLGEKKDTYGIEWDIISKGISIGSCRSADCPTLIITIYTAYLIHEIDLEKETLFSINWGGKNIQEN